MGEAAVLIKTIPIYFQSKPFSSSSSSSSSSSFPTKFTTVALSRKKEDLSLISKRRSRGPRRLVTISTEDGKWHGNWTCEYLISLRDLHLQDLIEDQHTNAQVSVVLTLQKHASFGLSVEGRILTSFTRICTNCFFRYCRQIDSKFNVWVLQSNKDNDEVQIPEIGGDDPSVIYVKPGCEANLDSLIKDTLRLTVSVKDFCSESCEKSQPTLQFIGKQSTASIDKRWSKLLELKKSTS